MAKNTRQGAESFDGGTFESYPDKKNWWVAAHLQGFLSDSKIGIIVHYNESSCDSVYTYYQGIYGDKLSYICEDNNTQKYKHYNQ